MGVNNVIPFPIDRIKPTLSWWVEIWVDADSSNCKYKPLKNKDELSAFMEADALAKKEGWDDYLIFQRDSRFDEPFVDNLLGA